MTNLERRKPMQEHDLFLEAQDKTSQLDKALGSLGKCGRENALAEKNYRIALRKAILLERNKGTPVTIILNLVKGEDEVSELRFKRDVAETLYKACLEGINVLKLEVKILEEQISREYGRR